MSGEVNIDKVSAAMEKLLNLAGRPVVMEDVLGGKSRDVDAKIASAPDGLLPLFLMAGEAIWREATGDGFALSVTPDEGALDDVRVTKIGDASFTAVMLSMMEASFQAARPEGIMVDELRLVWRGAALRFDARIKTPPRRPEGSVAS